MSTGAAGAVAIIGPSSFTTGRSSHSTASITGRSFTAVAVGVDAAWPHSARRNALR